MPESFTQVPPNSTGNKMRTRSRVIGADTVHEQAVFQGALPTYYAVADATTFANGKTHISLVNAVGSGVVVALRKLFAINLQTSAVTGAALRLDVRRITGHSAGSLITPTTTDSNNPSLPAEITVRTNSTPTSPVLLYPFIVTVEEETATAALSKNMFQSMTNLQPEGLEIQELRLREGEGVCVTQITNSTVGSYAWFAVFTVDDDS
jgi:hypothetical protein